YATTKLTPVTSAANGTSALASGLKQLAAGTQKLADGATTAADKGSAIPTGAAAAASGSEKLAAGAEKLSKVDKMIDEAVKKALPKAEKKALQQVAFERNLSVKDGKLAVDWSDPVQRWAMVDKLVPTLIDAINSGDTSDVKADTSASDTSFLTGADPRLTKPFMSGFNDSVVTIYWVGLAVMLVAFVITWFFRVPPLRTRSALQEKSDLSDSAALEGLA
ncbi:MAG: MFS transporter, partial [Propionicimonas sp.]